jgi:hypothetical protein
MNEASLCMAVSVDLLRPLPGGAPMIGRNPRPWGSTKGFRIVRYHHTNWYGRETTKWIVEEIIGQWNDYIGWEVYYELFFSRSEDEAILWLVKWKEKIARRELEEKRRRIVITCEESQRLHDFEEALASLDKTRRQAVSEEE